MTPQELQAYFERPLPALLDDPQADVAHAALLVHLESGTVRAAQRDDEGRWRANAWVKQAILVGFRRSSVVDYSTERFGFFDKEAYPARRLGLADGVRIVPGGTSVRRGAYVARGVVMMPPAYVNVGAWVGEQTMVDSHALVGSCAQIGARVHLSAGAQVGGVLEPAGAVPVVVEDEVFVGALTGLFEGVCVRRRAVLAPGVTLTASSVVYDLVHGHELRREIPENAVVVPGSRPATGDFARAHGLQLGAPMIVKYRDARTDAATALEEALR
jgi:2,3,4,5-tetrahydropyridine-2-carboxylate N-succinyltransferase